MARIWFVNLQDAAAGSRKGTATFLLRDQIQRERRAAYLEVREGPVREDEAATEEKARRQVSGVRQRGDQRNGTHLPIVRERRWAEHQPTIKRREIAKR